MFKTVYLLLGVLLVLFSCKSQTTLADLNMKVLVEGNYSGVAEEELLPIKNKKELVSFFAKINRTRKPGLPIPEVNFEQEFLIVWCPGENYTIAPELSIKKETAEALIFKKSTTSQKALTAAVTSPFKIYKLPITAKTIILD